MLDSKQGFCYKKFTLQQAELKREAGVPRTRNIALQASAMMGRWLVLFYGPISIRRLQCQIVRP